MVFQKKPEIRATGVKAINYFFKLLPLDLDAVAVHNHPASGRVFLGQFTQLVFPDAEIFGRFFNRQRVFFPDWHISIIHTFKDSWMDTEVEAELSMQSYLDRLDEELSKQPGFKRPPVKTIRKRRTTSKTDPDSGCINHGKKSGIGYLMETTVDCKYGIITGVDVYPANEKESLLVLRHLERQIQNGVPMQNIALDRGYDTGAVHRGLELLGITGYIPAIQFSNSPEKYGFYYLPQEDAFCCPEGAKLVYQRLNCSQTTGKYLRCYQVQGDTCKQCKQNATCFKQTGVRRRILGSSCYPAFYRGHQRIGSDTYWHMMRLRKIWAEGSFSVLKREHCLSKIRKRGIPAVTEECLLSAMALNLKRMVRAILLTSHMLKIRAKSLCFQLGFLFCQQVPYSTLSIPDGTSPSLMKIKIASCKTQCQLRSTSVPYTALFLL